MLGSRVYLDLWLKSKRIGVITSPIWDSWAIGLIKEAEYSIPEFGYKKVVITLLY
jgi:hypothetical protein